MQNLHQEPNNSPHAGITSSCVAFVWSNNRQIVGEIILLFSSCCPCPFWCACPRCKSLLCPFPEHIPHPTICARVTNPSCVSTALYTGKLISEEEKGTSPFPFHSSGFIWGERVQSSFCLSYKSHLCLSSLLSVMNSCQPFTDQKRCYQGL